MKVIRLRLLPMNRNSTPPSVLGVFNATVSPCGNCNETGTGTAVQEGEGKTWATCKEVVKEGKQLSTKRLFAALSRNVLLSDVLMLCVVWTGRVLLSGGAVYGLEG